MAVADIIMLPPVAGDARRLAAELRVADAAEVRASTGREPLPVIIEAIAMSSEVWALHLHGGLACIWGVVRDDSAPSAAGRVGIAWMLTTPVIERWPLLFWRTCLRVLPLLLRNWEVLVNAIDARHKQALRWARRLGFRLDPPAPFGAEGLDFCLFTVTLGDLRV